jgi:hypothetical protein
MSAQSKRYRSLSKRIHELRRSFLPKNFNPTGQYTSFQIDKTIAFRLLVHSEIESYFEDRAREIANKALRNWKKNAQPSKVLMCLLAFTDKNWGLPPETVKNIQGQKPIISERLETAAKIYFSKLETNHGVRERNILQILLPIGIDYDQIDPFWLTEIDSFGGRRGEVAHKSKLTITEIDPKDEWEKVKKVIIPGIKDIDLLLNTLP